jgi:ferric-dicitrate binding protein FerR (iron transport regulator)
LLIEALILGVLELENERPLVIGYFMDCKEAQLLTVSHILGDLNPDSRQHRELEAHLLSCQTCAEEYAGSKWVVGFIESHKAEFAEVLGLVHDKADEQKQLESSWQCIEAKLDKIEAQERQEKQVKLHRKLWKVTAAAACVAVGISVWLMLSNSKTLKNPIMQPLTAAPAQSIKIEILSDTGNVIIPADTEVKTTASELKILIINDEHRIVMNSDTTLRVEPLIENSYLGCLVKLASGEILAHAEHDGNPFVLSTAHGKAVITGTTFGVKATDDTTMLVVSKGTVRFESEEGVVEVSGDQTSEIFAKSAPSKPTSCNSAELTAWATGREVRTGLVEIESYRDAHSFDDIEPAVNAGPINLETIDYDDWVDKKQDWFKREFPWIFQLKDALAKEGIEVHYPELLIQSGDIWQFVCLDVSPARFSVINPDSLLKTTSNYGFDQQWLLENVSLAKYALEKPIFSKDSFTGLKTFERWFKYLDEVEGLEASTLIYSYHASVYLVETRSLIWFTVRDGKYDLTDEERAEVLALLQKEITAACKCKNYVLYPQKEPKSSSGEDKCRESINDKTKLISIIYEGEKTLVRYIPPASITSK